MKLQVAIVYALLMLQVCVSFRVTYPKHAKPVYGKESVKLCGNTWCNEYRYEDLDKQFPGTFFTNEEYSEGMQLSDSETSFCRTEVPWLQSSVRRGPRCPCQYGKHDGGHCCGTCRYSKQAPEYIDVNDEDCWVLQCPGFDKYQYIPEGICSETGTCTGTCVNETTFHKLLCWLPGEGFKFAFFKHPAYCTCKS